MRKSIAIPNTGGVKFFTPESQRPSVNIGKNSMSSRGSYLTGASGSRYNEGLGINIKDALNQKDRENQSKRKQFLQKSKFGSLQKKSVVNLQRNGSKRQVAMQEPEIEEVKGIYLHKKD